LVYASELEPDAIVDIATLTGACVVALGDEIAGFWTENNSLATALESAAADAGEGLWRMPMHHPYRKGLKSLLADLKKYRTPSRRVHHRSFISQRICPKLD
jgi:leucyl aminopeptidase